MQLIIKKEQIIRDALEFWRYCEENLGVFNSSRNHPSSESKAKTVKRKFYFVKEGSVDRSTDRLAKYNPQKGIRAIHEARSTGDSAIILTRNRGCACISCLTEETASDCININLVDSLV